MKSRNKLQVVMFIKLLYVKLYLLNKYKTNQSTTKTSNNELLNKLFIMWENYNTLQQIDLTTFQYHGVGNEINLFFI